MSKICNKCGAELADEANVCDSCANKSARAEKTGTKPAKKKLIAAVCAAVAVVLTLAVVFSLGGGNASLSPQERIFSDVLEAFRQGDAEALVALFPEFKQEYSERYIDDAEKDVEKFTDFVSQELGDGKIEYDYEIRRDTGTNQAELEELKQSFEAEYDSFDKDKFRDIRRNMYLVEITSAGKTVTAEINTTCVLYDGQWYLLFYSCSYK